MSRSTSKSRESSTAERRQEANKQSPGDQITLKVEQDNAVGKQMLETAKRKKREIVASIFESREPLFRTISDHQQLSRLQTSPLQIQRPKEIIHQYPSVRKQRSTTIPKQKAEGCEQEELLIPSRIPRSKPPLFDSSKKEPQQNNSSIRLVSFNEHNSSHKCHHQNLCPQAKLSKESKQLQVSIKSPKIDCISPQFNLDAQLEVSQSSVSHTKQEDQLISRQSHTLQTDLAFPCTLNSLPVSKLQSKERQITAIRKRAMTSSIVQSKTSIRASSGGNSPNKITVSPSTSTYRLNSYHAIKQNTKNPNSAEKLTKSPTITKTERRICDLQTLIERMRIDNLAKLERIELKQLEEENEKDKIFEEQCLDLKVQQKKIFLLMRERDQQQGQSDENEMKVRQLQNQIKYFDKLKKGLEDEISQQLITVSEGKTLACIKQMQYKELHRKYQILQQQCDQVEKERNTAVNNKLKAENSASDQATKFTCISKLNMDLTIELERRNKEYLYQVSQLMLRLDDMTQKYVEEKSNHEIYEKKFKSESIEKDSLKTELKLIIVQVKQTRIEIFYSLLNNIFYLICRENENLKKKLATSEKSLEEVEGVVDDLKRKIRNNINIDMKHRIGNSQVERIIEKPIFIEKMVDVSRSQSDIQLIQQYRTSLDKSQAEINELRQKRIVEQEQLHQKILECETWKNHTFMLEDKFRAEIASLHDDTKMNMLLNGFSENKDQQISELKQKIHCLLAEVELLTSANIEKNKIIAATFIQNGENVPPLLFETHANPPPISIQHSSRTYIPYNKILD